MKIFTLLLPAFHAFQSCTSSIDINSRTANSESTEADFYQASKFIEQVTSNLHQVETSDGLKYNFTTEIVSSELKCPEFNLYPGQNLHSINGKSSVAEIHLVCYINKFVDFRGVAMIKFRAVYLPKNV